MRSSNPDLFVARALWSAMLVACAVAFANADERTPPEPAVSTDRQQLIDKRGQLWQASKTLGAQQDWRAALDAARRSLAIQRTHFAQDPDSTSTMLAQWISECQAKLHHYTAAIASAEEAESLCNDLFGQEHWTTVSARLKIANFRQLAGLNAGDAERVHAALQQEQDALALHQQGKSTDAAPRAEQAATTLRELLGADHVFTTTALNDLGLIYAESRRSFLARPVLEEAAKVRLRTCGAKHPDTLVTLGVLAAVYAAINDPVRAERLYKDCFTGHADLFGPEHPSTLAALQALLAFYSQQERLADAERAAVDLLQRATKAHGEEDTTTNYARLQLGLLHYRQEELNEAQPHLELGLAIQRRVAVADLDSLATEAASALATIYCGLAKVTEARQLLSDNVEAIRKARGATDPAMAQAAAALAQCYLETGDFVNAERWQLGVRSAFVSRVPRNRRDVSEATFLLAKIYAAMGDFELAKHHLDDVDLGRLEDAADALAIEKWSLMATVYNELGSAEVPDVIYQNIRPRVERCWSDDSLLRATFAVNLARFYEKTGRLADAEQLLRRALDTLQRKKGRDHYTTAAAAVRLARVLVASGGYEEARGISTAALATLDRIDGNCYTIDVEAILSLAMAELALNEQELAVKHLERGLILIDQAKNYNATVQSERQQIFVAEQTRPMLNLFLSLPTETQPAFAYQHVLADKGAAATRVNRCRDQLTATGRDLFKQLQTCTAAFANTLLRMPKSSNRVQWHMRLSQLELEKEHLEALLAYENPLNRQLAIEVKDATTQLASAVTNLQDTLPASAALVDLYQFERITFGGQEPDKTIKEQRLAAFIVRRDQPVLRIDLGSVAPIEAAINEWRSTNGFPAEEEQDSPAEILGKLLWQPLEPHVAGCELVLVSPAGAVAQLPWSVLPGRRPGSYLIEDVAIGVVPIPQLLLKAVAGERPPGEVPSSEKLLVVGNVDFDARHGGEEAEPAYELDPDQRRRPLFRFEPLAGTAEEINSLRKTYDDSHRDGAVVALEREEATEAAFRTAAADCRWLHIATHGFFAPPNVKQLLVDRLNSEDLLLRLSMSSTTIGYSNGLALAGANNHSIGNGDDGILVAAELATFDLRNVELAVLSGCETGLGELEAFEGALGLQRALQIAGVRTTVTSLWNVSDEKTNLLMQRFYANLWQKKLPKLAALREAQLWMLNTGGSAAALPSDERLPPHYWAAFTLSGDWR